MCLRQKSALAKQLQSCLPARLLCQYAAYKHVPELLKHAYAGLGWLAALIMCCVMAVFNRVLWQAILLRYCHLGGPQKVKYGTVHCPSQNIFTGASAVQSACGSCAGKFKAVASIQMYDELVHGLQQ